MIKVSVVGGSGYAGGELLRILLNHPKVKIAQATSERFVDQKVSLVHPNLRRQTNLLFSGLDKLKACDLLFIALPNGKSMGLINQLIKLAPKIIDLGADFRLKSTANWQKWYQTKHLKPNLLKKFVYGLPEIHRQEIKKANLIAGPGCEAIVSILCLYPLIKHNIINSQNIIIDAKMGSSQAGNKAVSSSHHPERAGVVRSYLPTGHRHTAEIKQELKTKVSISATAIEMVRGILVTINTKSLKNLTDKDIWQTYLKEYKNEPFVRIVKQSQGLYRYPEPKILSGTNFCEIGFSLDRHSSRLVVLGAIDNLVKGTAGNAAQCMNLMYGWPETLGLEFCGLHPI